MWFSDDTPACVCALNVAVTEVLAEMVILHEPVPVQAPPHPPKVEVELAAWVRVMAVPEGKLALQVEPQLMPEGLLVMVPPPPPELCTVS